MGCLLGWGVEYRQNRSTYFLSGFARDSLRARQGSCSCKPSSVISIGWVAPLTHFRVGLLTTPRILLPSRNEHTTTERCDVIGFFEIKILLCWRLLAHRHLDHGVVMRCVGLFLVQTILTFSRMMFQATIRMTTSFSWWLVLFIPASSGFSPSSSSSMTAIGQLRTAHEGSSNRLIAQEPLLASLLAEPSVELAVANNDVAPKEEQIFFANEAKTSDSSIVPLKGMEIVMLPDVPSRYQKIQPGRYSNKDNSIAIPLLKRPPALDGSHAGDCGFDPFGFTETYDLYTMQEAELRHARLAMLAVVGWPLSELVAPQWMLQNENGCAPSVLNGFNPVSFLGFLAIFGAIGFFEFKTCFRQVANTPSGRLHQSDMADVWKWGVAGDYGFDPLNLYSSIGNDAYSRKGLRDVEISHGRSAMLAITYFAFWEAITGHPIVENSMFFHPNLLLPILAAGYFAFNSLYELEESDTYVRFQLNSEGSAKLENLKLAFRSSEDDNSNESALVPRSETIMNTVSDIKDFVLSLDVEGMLKGLEKGKQ